MAQTSINIRSTTRSGGKIANKAITFVNNDAKNEDLADLGIALNALTTNNYVETNRVDKSNCDTEQAPTITIGDFTQSKSAVELVWTAALTYNGSGELYGATALWNGRTIPLHFQKTGNSWSVKLSLAGSDPDMISYPQSIAVIVLSSDGGKAVKTFEP